MAQRNKLAGAVEGVRRKVDGSKLRGEDLGVQSPQAVVREVKDGETRQQWRQGPTQSIQTVVTKIELTKAREVLEQDRKQPRKPRTAQAHHLQSVESPKSPRSGIRDLEKGSDGVGTKVKHREIAEVGEDVPWYGVQLVTLEVDLSKDARSAERVPR